FTFDPVPEPGFLGTIWHPHFTADPGVFDRLEVDDVALKKRTDGTFSIYLFGFNYNPSEYRLVTKDGISYRYNQFTDLVEITDRNSNKLTFTDAGIFASSGQSIQFIRDSLGRITQIIDPAGNAISYVYDAAGDLISTTDQVGNTTQYCYFPSACGSSP